MQLTQVLINLAINARDAMPRGGRLSLHVRNRVLRYLDTLAPGDTPPGDYVELAVADTGVGLTPKVKARLFEPFFTTKEEGQGTGLGLATSWTHHRRGRRLHPRRRRRRARARRSASSCRAPRVGPTGRSCRARRRPSTSPVGGTALVVEDNDAVRATLVGAAERERLRGDRPRTDGEQALDFADARTAPLAFLVTDMMLPGMSGLDVARQVQARRPACHVLFITGYLDLVHRNALPPGASLLQKPFSLRALLAELDKLRLA